ncbi:hypothetical protein CJU90_4744 [Yarrowia sp. C11]|nr:hypothetical protein CJU90_4744 [Yarrowia sp. C11]
MPPTSTTLLVTRTLLARKETPSCGDREKCPMPANSQSLGLPIGLGIGIPIVGAIIIFAFLHWRNLKRLKKEAEEDRDFDRASVLYDDDGKGYNIESHEVSGKDAAARNGEPRTNYHQDFNQNDPFFDSPYILKGEEYSDNYSRSLTNLSMPYAGMPPPGLLPNHSGFLASLGGDRYPSSPASSVFRAPHLNSSAASLASAGGDSLRKPAPTYLRQEQLPKKDLSENDMVNQQLPPPVPRMNASRPSLSNPNSPIEPHYSHHKQFSIGSVSDSDVEDPFERESNIVHTPVVSSFAQRDLETERDQQQSSSFQSKSSSGHTSQDSRDSLSRVVSEQSTATTPDDSGHHHKADGYFDDKNHLDHAPTVPVPPIPDEDEDLDTTSPPTQFDRVRSVYQVYFDEKKETAMREAALAQEGVAETEGNLTLASEKDLPVSGDVTSDSFPADLTVDTVDYSSPQMMRGSHFSQSSSVYDHSAGAAAPPVSAGYSAAQARVPIGVTAPLNTNRSNNYAPANAPVNALKIDFAPATPDLNPVPHQHASPVGSSSPHSNWGTPPQDGYGFHPQEGYQQHPPPPGAGYHGGAPAEAYFPQQTASQPRRKPPPLQLKPLQTVPTPHKLDQSDLGVTSFVPTQKRIQTPTGSNPGSPVTGQAPAVGYNPLHNPLHSMTDTEMMPSPHALRKSVSLASLDFAPPARFGRDSSRNNSLTSQFSAGGTPIPRQQPTHVRSKMDTATMLKPSWEMRD